MYQSCGQMMENIKSVARCRNNADEVAMIWRIMRQCYIELCAATSWVHLRTSKAYSFSSATDSTGFWMPGNMLGVDMVRSASTDDYHEYILRDKAGVDYDEAVYRWYYSDVSMEPHLEGNDLDVVTGASTLTSATLTASPETGEFIKFGDEPGIYELTAATTFTPAYQGKNLSDARFQVRPPGTKKFTVLDPAAEYDSNASVVLHYWKMPPPLYRESDLVLLPSARPLELMTLIRFIGQQRKSESDANVFRQELAGADGKSGVLADMMRDNPSFPSGRGTRDQKNQQMTYGQDIFGRRGYFTKAGQAVAEPRSFLDWN